MRLPTVAAFFKIDMGFAPYASHTCNVVRRPNGSAIPNDPMFDVAIIKRLIGFQSEMIGPFFYYPNLSVRIPAFFRTKIDLTTGVIIQLVQRRCSISFLNIDFIKNIFSSVNAQPGEQYGLL